MNKHGRGPGEGPVEFSGGYFQVPDMVFDLPLAANEKLVLIYFMRRSDRAGRSFPSVDRICRDCGMKSENTARKAVRNLVSAGLIHKKLVPGRSHDYFVSRELCRVIEEAKERYVKKEIASPDESAKFRRYLKDETLKQVQGDRRQGHPVTSRRIFFLPCRAPSLSSAL